MKKKVNILVIMSLLISSLLISCDEKEDFTESIFNTEIPELNPDSYTYDFDKFLRDEFRVPYNLQFIYRMEDTGTNMNYNFCPPSYIKSKHMAVIIKELLFEVFKGNVFVSGYNKEFMYWNGPRIVQLTGNLAINPANLSQLQGSASSGVKLNIFDVNSLNVSSLKDLKDKYIHGLFRDFGFILQSRERMPQSFVFFSSEYYKPSGWNINEKIALSLGFVTPYAGSGALTDFSEVFARYLVCNEEEWNNDLSNASKGWKMNENKLEECPDYDGVNGNILILDKLDMVRTWLRDNFNVDIEKLKFEVQRRILLLDSGYINGLLIEYGIE